MIRQGLGGVVYEPRAGWKTFGAHLYRKGSEGAASSGSAVFGLFPDKRARKEESMRKVLCLCLLCCLTLAAGCGRTRYAQEGRSAAEEERDYLDCLYEAQKATGNLSEENDDRGGRIEEMVVNCMTLKGYVED